MYPFASIVIKSTEIDYSVKMFTIIVRHVKLIKNIYFPNIHKEIIDDTAAAGYLTSV